MKLSEKELRILRCLHLRGDASVTEIAKRANVQETTARYFISKMVSEDVIRRRTYINVFAMGLETHILYFSMDAAASAKTDELLAYLVQSPAVTFVAQIGGEFSIKVAICVRNSREVAAFIADISDRFGRIFTGKSLAITLSLSDFPMKFLDPSQREEEFLRYGGPAGDVDIDELDHKILRCLTEIGNDSHRTIAKRIGVGETTVGYRVEKLRSKGVIVGSRYHFNFRKLGFQAFLHLLTARGVGETEYRRMFQFCLRHPNVYYLVECLGGWDYEIGTMVRTAEEATQFDQELRNEFASTLVRVTNVPLFSCPKVSNYPFAENPFQTAGEPKDGIGIRAK